MISRVAAAEPDRQPADCGFGLLQVAFGVRAGAPVLKQEALHRRRESYVIDQRCRRRVRHEEAERLTDARPRFGKGAAVGVAATHRRYGGDPVT